MAIEPQVHLGQTDNREFIANRKFTDRKEPRQAFDYQVQQIIEENLHNNPKHHVLVYYGIGGIGKSSLQRYFKSQIEKESKKNFYTYLDFSNSSFHHPNKAFLELINNIHCSYKFSFPHFWIAYAIYFKKINPEMVYQDKKFLKSESWTILSDLLSLMDGAGLISVIPGMVNKAYDVLQNFKLDKKIKNDLKQLENADVCSIEKKLPAFWAYDLKKNLEESHPPSTVIFLDTYEALWCNGRNEMTKYSVDSWIRELISHLKGVLFVICGREHLEWENINKDWKDILDQHLLEHLSPSDVETFLIECGICEDSIRQKMIIVSAGHPYHLDLLVDTYSEIRNAGMEPDVSMIASNRRQILECFLKYLRTEEIAAIKLMSIVRFYDFELFKFLLEKFPTGYSITLFHDFNKFSFVNELSSEQFYIHEIMRSEILRYIDHTLASQVHKTMSEYYLAHYNNTEDYLQKKISFKEMIYHVMHYKKPEKFAVFLNSTCIHMFQILQVRGDTNYLKDILLEIYYYFDKNIVPQVLNILIDMLQLNGQYKEAVLLAEKNISQLNYDEIHESPEYARMYVRHIHNQMTYCNTIELAQSLTTFITTMKTDDFHELYVDALFTLATLQLASGNYRTCGESLKKAYKKAEEHSLMLLLCRILRKLAEYFMGQNDFNNAYKICKNGILISKRENFERYHLYLQCDMAEWYRKNHMLDKAQNIYTHCGKEFKAKGIKSWTGHVAIGMALIEFDKQNYERCLEYLTIARQIYTPLYHAWGLMQVDVIHAKCSYCLNNFADLNELKLKIKHAHNMGYLREREILKQLYKNNNPPWTLLFL